MQKSSTRTEIVWIFTNQFWWSHAFPSNLTGEAKKLLLSLFHFPRMGFLSWKPRSPGHLCRSWLSPGRFVCFTLFEFIAWWPILWDTAWPRGDDRCYTKSVFPDIFTFSSLQAPVIVQCLCWKSQERDKKRRSILSTRRNEPNSPEIPVPHSALHWQPSPSSPMAGLALPLLWLLGSKAQFYLFFQVWKGTRFMFIPSSMSGLLHPSPGKGETWEQQIRSVGREESDYSSLFREWFSTQPSSRLFFFFPAHSS